MLSAPFTIQTNRIERFGNVHLLMSNRPAKIPDKEISAVVLVRYHYARVSGESPYNFIHGFYDMGSFVEFVPMKEYLERVGTAKDHGTKYMGLNEGLIAVTDPAFGNHVLYQSEDTHLSGAMAIIAECIEIERKFKALIDLDIFRLPVTL